jgi:hypothetical protein
LHDDGTIEACRDALGLSTFRRIRSEVGEVITRSEVDEHK